ncbi:MAG: hypothetical protein GY830_11300, partial [Bacteroidetes bacterium]|nr:hypothetical protein [Bacteroidota bacterium]
TKSFLKITYGIEIHEILNDILMDIDSKSTLNEISNIILKYIYPPYTMYEDRDKINSIINYFYINNNQFIALSLSKFFNSNSFARFISYKKFYPFTTKKICLKNCKFRFYYHAFSCIKEICPCLFKKLSSDLWICCKSFTKYCAILCIVLFFAIIILCIFLDYYFCESGNINYLKH